MSDEPRPGEEEREPGGDGEPPEEAGPPPPPRCEVCGAELDPDQTYCLECGAPTPLAPRLRRSGKALALLAGAMIVLGGGAGALAYAVVSDDDGGGGGSTASTGITAPTAPGTLPTAPSTGPLPPDTSFTSPTAPTAPTDTAGTATGFPTVTGPTAPPTGGTTTGAPTETRPPGTTTRAPGGGGSSDWPSGTTAWTAILSSVRSESDARAAKARVSGSGEPAGVLFSSDFPGLRPGYWVVYSGSYTTRAAAKAQARKLSGSWPGAYARRIEG